MHAARGHLDAVGRQIFDYLRLFPVVDLAAESELIGEILADRERVARLVVALDVDQLAADQSVHAGGGDGRAHVGHHGVLVDGRDRRDTGHVRRAGRVEELADRLAAAAWRGLGTDHYRRCGHCCRDRLATARPDRLVFHHVRFLLLLRLAAGRFCCRCDRLDSLYCGLLDCCCCSGYIVVNGGGCVCVVGKNFGVFIAAVASC